VRLGESFAMFKKCKKGLSKRKKKYKEGGSKMLVILGAFMFKL
jgi:hypothetical protein